MNVKTILHLDGLVNSGTLYGSTCSFTHWYCNCSYGLLSPTQDSGSYPPPYAADKSQEGTKRPAEAAVAVRIKN